MESSSDFEALTARIEKLEQLLEQTKVQPAPVLKAEEFVLVDRQGNPRARLAMAEQMVSLCTDDGKEIPVEPGPILLLLDLDGASSNFIHLTPTGPILRLSDRAGSETVITHEFMATRDCDPERFVCIGKDSVALRDGDGFVATLGVDNLTTASGEKRTRSAASLVLYGKEGKVLWSTP